MISATLLQTHFILLWGLTNRMMARNTWRPSNEEHVQGSSFSSCHSTVSWSVWIRRRKVGLTLKRSNVARCEPAKRRFPTLHPRLAQDKDGMRHVAAKSRKKERKQMDEKLDQVGCWKVKQQFQIISISLECNLSWAQATFEAFFQLNYFMLKKTILWEKKLSGKYFKSFFSARSNSNLRRKTKRSRSRVSGNCSENKFFSRIFFLSPMLSQVRRSSERPRRRPMPTPTPTVQSQTWPTLERLSSFSSTLLNSVFVFVFLLFLRIVWKIMKRQKLAEPLRSTFWPGSGTGAWKRQPTPEKRGQVLERLMMLDYRTA